jgi:undecaprenyl diphosphate synthase
MGPMTKTMLRFAPQHFIGTNTLHLAIIMDGNGRWAEQRGLPRLAGHRAGERALRRIVEAAPALGIHTLTVYAFSSDNWKRPAAEVDGLMLLLETHLAREVEVCLRNGVRLTAIGRRDRIPERTRKAIQEAERLTAAQHRLHLRMAIDYSSRDALLDASRRLTGEANRESMASALGGMDVDLLIRTGGEQRLSDFLLWECAYAELLFTRCLWPDFTPRELSAALDEFSARERRFGGLSLPSGGVPGLGRAAR